MALDNDGNLLVCEQVSSCLVRFRRGGERELVAFHYRGKYLNSPNDVVTRGSDGSIYFTDPDYGRWNDWIGQERSRDQLGFRGLYRVPPGGGDARAAWSPRTSSTSRTASASRRTSALLYVNDSSAATSRCSTSPPTARSGRRRLLHEGIGSGVPEEGNVDGMECDEHGNVWVTGPGGVWVLTPGRRAPRRRSRRRRSAAASAGAATICARCS